MSKKLFLLSALLVSACGYVETSGTQRDYVSDRDRCRAMAESKVPLERLENKDQKNRLLSAFSECMKKTGWDIKGPDDVKPKPEDPPADTARKPQAAVIAPPPAPVVMLTPAVSPWMGATRAEQCAYARHAQYNSSIAADMASDCDRECKIEKKMASCPVNK